MTRLISSWLWLSTDKVVTSSGNVLFAHNFYPLLASQYFTHAEIVEVIVLLCKRSTHASVVSRRWAERRCLASPAYRTYPTPSLKANSIILCTFIISIPSQLFVAYLLGSKSNGTSEYTRHRHIIKSCICVHQTQTCYKQLYVYTPDSDIL